jgi:hypothetical protein
MAFNYFSGGTSTGNFPKPVTAPTYYSSGTATKPAPYSGVPRRGVRKPVRPSQPRNYGGGGGRRYGGGGGGGYTTPVRSGKSVGSNSSGRIAKTAPAPAPAPKPLTPDEWLAGDTVYKQQRDLLSGAMGDYTTRSQKEGTDYGITNAANRKALLAEQDRSKQDLINDYTSRGMLGGALQTAETDFGTDWTKRLGDFDTAYQNWQNDQAQAATDYKTANAAQLTKAQQDALARRAAKYGL